MSAGSTDLLYSVPVTFSGGEKNYFQLRIKKSSYQITYTHMLESVTYSLVFIGILRPSKNVTSLLVALHFISASINKPTIFFKVVFLMDFFFFYLGDRSL